MGVKIITTGKYIDQPSGLTAECVCVPLTNKLEASIAIKEDRIFVNYEKLFYDEEDNLLPEKTEKYSYALRTQEEISAFLESQLINGSSIWDGLDDKIVARMKKDQNIG